MVCDSIARPFWTVNTQLIYIHFCFFTRTNECTPKHKHSSSGFSFRLAIRTQQNQICFYSAFSRFYLFDISARFPLDLICMRISFGFFLWSSRWLCHFWLLFFLRREKPLYTIIYKWVSFAKLCVIWKNGFGLVNMRNYDKSKR